jgi:ParB family chromosome partitioning protein
MMYAMDNAQREIKIGYSTDGHRRISAHTTNGFELLAAWPATQDDEKETHKRLRPHRMEGRGKETYLGTEVYDYITGLLGRNYAAPTIAEARALPRLPIEVWGFGKDLTHVRADGQGSLLDAYEPHDRPRLISELPWNSSESDEWFTPAHIIEPARRAMGTIDTDPASCAEANKTVKADLWYGRHQDGLDPLLPWRGNVWLNPPYGTGNSSAGHFVDRLVRELGQGAVHQAVTCLNLNSMGSLWFETIFDVAALHCIYRGRINFTPPGGGNSSPTKGTVLSYFGKNLEAFAEQFRPLGHVLEVRA